MELTVKRSTRTGEVYQFIKFFINRHGYSPSTRDIGNALSLSTSVVSYCLDILQAQNHIRHDDGIARSIRLVKHENEETQNTEA